MWSARERRSALRDAFLERGALDELHDDRAGVAALLEAVDVRDERMIQRREHARFALEPRQPVRIVDDRVGKDLDRDLALEARIARAVDLAHPTSAERADDFVGTETGASGVSGHGLERLSCLESSGGSRSLHRPEVGVVPVEHVADHAEHVVRDVAAFERDELLLSGGVPSSSSRRAGDSGGFWKSFRPLMMSTGTLTRGAKLAGWISGG